MVYRRGKLWWFKFVWRGELVRESTKQHNKRIAEQLEAARRTQLAKGEVGIRDRIKAPTVQAFSSEFMDYVRSRFAEGSKTTKYYEFGVRHVTAFPAIGRACLSEITGDSVMAFVAHLRAKRLSVTSVNRALQVLRRMLHVALEWDRIEKMPAKITMVSGERRRDRTLSFAEEAAYLEATQRIGREAEEAYQHARVGIRCLQRGEEPVPPRDPYLLRHMATLLLDTGLRPEEAYRLRWEDVRDGMIRITHGKTPAARRQFPIPTRVAAILEMRREAALSPEWVFPAGTRSGHCDQSTLRKQHYRACTLAGLERLPLYSFRHTFLTRLAGRTDPFTLATIAGHADFATSRRYVHVQPDTIREAMGRIEEARDGHKSGHTPRTGDAATEAARPVIN